MKKSVFYSIGLTVATGIAFMTAPTFAASTTTQSWDPGLTQAKSCAEVEGVVKEYFTTNWYGGYFGPMREAAVANDASAQSVAPPTGKGGAGGSMDFSETNTQKTGVDEPDIIKNDGTYIYYADMQQNRQIHIVSVASNKEVATITLPADFWGAQFFVTK